MLLLVLSAKITLMVLKYIYKLLKLKPPVQFYYKLLDRPNIMYIIKEILKLKYEDLLFPITNKNRASTIPKTIYFVDNIEDL